MFFISHTTLSKYIHREVDLMLADTIKMRWNVEFELNKLIDQQALDKAWDKVINDPNFTERMVENINKYQLK